MTTRLSIKMIGNDCEKPLEVRVNTENGMLRIGDREIQLEDFNVIGSEEEYRDWKYPCIKVIYASGDGGREFLERDYYKILGLFDGLDGCEVKGELEKRHARSYFLDLVFPEDTVVHRVSE